ncbi:MAG TPA: ABC transporter permease [Pirellulales bacterium]
MYFFTFLLKNLLRRPARSLLTITGLAVAVGAVVSLVGVATGFENSFMDIYNSRDVDIVVQRAGKGTEKITRGLPEDWGNEIAKVKGVKQVIGGLVDMISFEKQGLMGVVLNGWAPDCPLFNRLTIIQGRGLKEGDAGKTIIGRVLAANLNKHVGDTIEYYSQPYKIVGIYESPIVFENGGAAILLKDQQNLMAKPNQISGYTVTVEKPMTDKEIETVRERIEALQPGSLEATKSSDFVKGVQQIRVSQAVAWLTSAIALIIGAIGMLNTMIMSVFERTKEIGTLRAIGWKRSRIVKMVIGESVLLSLGGAVVGSVAGVLLVKFLTHLPNAAGIVSGKVSAPVIAQGFLVALIVGVSGSIYPALWSANLLPTEALRGK